MKKILVIGINGQLGQELKQTLINLGEIIGVGRETLDLAQSTRIYQVIDTVKPDVIVNAAAYTAVDKAETEKELAYAINAIAPKIMAQAAQKIKAKLIHISTDYVFDGCKNTPYLENDPTNPLSVYGQSKLAAEEGIRQIGAGALILRTAWVYGVYGKNNFVKTMLRLGREREEIKIVSDQIGSPTWAKEIACAIAQLIFLGNLESTETYHFTNSGVASWYDFAVAIFEEAKLIGFPLKIQQVIPITTLDYPTPAQRPAYSVLSTQKIATRLEKYSPHWRNSLRQMLKQLNEVRIRNSEVGIRNSEVGKEKPITNNQ